MHIIHNYGLISTVRKYESLLIAFSGKYQTAKVIVYFVYVVKLEEYSRVQSFPDLSPETY